MLNMPSAGPFFHKVGTKTKTLCHLAVYWVEKRNTTIAMNKPKHEFAHPCGMGKSGSLVSKGRFKIPCRPK
jgi:hypothetical protein